MYSSEIIKSNLSIIDECLIALKQQLDDSYKPIRIPKYLKTEIKIKSINQLDSSLVDFYESFIPLVKFVNDLKYSIIDMEYTTEELMIYIDKSPSYIADLEKKLSTKKNQIQKYYNQLLSNNDIINNEFCAEIKKLKSDYGIAITINFVNILYKCMEYDFKFIPYGVNIFSYLYEYMDMNDEIKNQIVNLSNKLKLKYLSTSEKDTQFNKQKVLLQTFNLIPSTSNMELNKIFKYLFNINIDKVNINNLKNVLSMVSKSLKKHISFIIISKNNNDFYYDLSNLFNSDKLSKINNLGGVSSEFIDIFKILQTILISKRIDNSVLAYNFTELSETYLLWTNDNINFKIREKPAESHIVNKLLLEESSEIIDLYNKNIENQLLEIIKDESLVSYKQVKYLSFDIDNEEQEYLTLLCKKIISYIKSIKKINFNTQLSDKCIDIMNDEFNKFKPFHKHKAIPVQALLIYNNLAVRLSNKIEKEIQIWSINNNASINEIDTIIKNIIQSNDNIYTSFISSYYLGISVMN